MITVRYSSDIAGVFTSYDYSSPAAMGFCLLLFGASLIALGFNGGTACVVIITLDRYWKIVHPVHHRKHYRRWMTHVGVFLPWLNGIVVHFVPAVATTRIVDTVCITSAFRAQVCHCREKRLI